MRAVTGCLCLHDQSQLCEATELWKGSRLQQTFINDLSYGPIDMLKSVGLEVFEVPNT